MVNNKINLIVYTWDRKVKYELADYISDLIQKDEKLKQYDIDVMIAKTSADVIADTMDKSGKENNKYHSVFMDYN